MPTQTGGQRAHIIKRIVELGGPDPSYMEYANDVQQYWCDAAEFMFEQAEEHQRSFDLRIVYMTNHNRSSQNTHVDHGVKGDEIDEKAAISTGPEVEPSHWAVDNFGLQASEAELAAEIQKALDDKNCLSYRTVAEWGLVATSRQAERL